MYKTEKQFSNNASRLPVEEVYTNVDLDKSVEWDQLGIYDFHYPQRWTSDPSQKKAIGVRRLKIIPSEHVFSLGVAGGITEADAWEAIKNHDSVENKSVYMTIDLAITSNNSLDEIMNEISKLVSENSVGTMKFHYRYDYIIGELEMFMTGDSLDPSVVGPDKRLYFCFEELYDTNEFLKFLNQPSLNSNVLTEASQSKYFRGVWNRENLYIHSSFSNSNMHFLGLNNDHYEDPSIFYQYSTNSSDFQIWFTTNMHNKILPFYCEFILQFCFIINLDSYNA